MSATAPSPVEAPTRVDYVALPAGALVGRYQIVNVLGQGGFGITYLARDTQLGREVAVKEYLPAALAVRPDGSSVLPRSTEVADDFGWGRSRFIEEGRTLASLHEAPSIVKVFDFLEANGTAYIVMELLRGGTLEDRVKAEGPLPPAGLQAILPPLLAGLQKVHEAGFLHRDIKPANIMLGADGRPTLIDFGAARVAMADRSRTMTAIFTPGYAAPEQFTSAKQGPWTDIYGLSATLHYAITGKAPPSAFDRLMADTYEPLAGSCAAGFDAGLLPGIDAGLSLPPEQRPSSIAAWRALLGEEPADSEPTLVMAPAAPRTAAPPARRPAPCLSPIRRASRLAGARRRCRPDGDGRRLHGLRSRADAPGGARGVPVGRRDAATVRGSGGSSVEPLDGGPSAHPDRAHARRASTRAARDGTFGPRSREMIAAWQQAQKHPATGYLTAAESQALRDASRHATGGRSAGRCAGRRRLLRGVAVRIGDGRRRRSAGAHGSGPAPCRRTAQRPDRSSGLWQPAGFADGRCCRRGQRQPASPRGRGLHDQRRLGERPPGGQHTDARSARRRRELPRHAVVARRRGRRERRRRLRHAHRHAVGLDRRPAPEKPLHYFGVIATTATLLLIAVSESPGLTRGNCARPSGVLTL